MRRLILPLICVPLIFVLAACQSAPGADSNFATPGSAPASTPVVVASGTFQQITPETLAGMLANKDFFFVNTHIPYEGEIAQTDAFIAYNEIEHRLNELPTDKGAMIVLYCRSGRMSAIAAEDLVDAGYTNVWDLAGGFTDWTAAGFELIVK
jgi:rhodanese-related sulfurtransferase